MMATMTVIGSAQVSEKEKLARKVFTEYCAASREFGQRQDITSCFKDLSPGPF